MDELDKRLRSIIQGDILGDWAVGEVKQAFIDADWRPDLGQSIFYEEKLKVMAKYGGYMTGQEWADAFWDEFLEEFDSRKYITPEGSIVDHEFEKDLRKWAAREAAGLEP